MKIRLTQLKDAADISDIYAPIVRDTAISFETVVPAIQDFEQRITNTLEKYPWLVVEENEKVIGYAYAGVHRARAAYQWCCESSVYVHPDHHKKGIARQLYTDLFDRLKAQNIVNVFAGATLPNDASVGFHESMGFKPVGIYKNIGFKNGQWHDVGWWQLRLAELEEPTDFKSIQK